MKTTEEYLDDYFDKYNKLKKQNELWRLRVTPQEFLLEVERIRAYGIEQRKTKYLNEYHIQKNQEGMIAVMLMDAMTHLEIKEQFDRLDIECKIQYAIAAPEIQERLKKIQTPLKFNDVVSIYRWLFRKQITLDMLSKEVFEEFRNTRQYEVYIERLSSRVNKNNPEFKKIARLTKQPSEEIATALAMWQDHMGTDDFPDGITVQMMFSGRKRYGSFNQYLNALYTSNKKGDLVTALKMLSEKTNSIVTALSKLVPGLKIAIHHTQEAFVKAELDVKSETNRQSLAGFYDSKANTIHLNLVKLAEHMIIQGHRWLNTLEHVTIHLLLDIIEEIAPGTRGELFKDLQSLEKELMLDGKYTVEFASKYKGEKSQQEEAVDEFIADIASGNLDIRALKKTKIQIMANFFTKMLAQIGINIRPYVRKGESIFNLARLIRRIFMEGKPIDSIVPRNKIGEIHFNKHFTIHL